MPRFNSIHDDPQPLCIKPPSSFCLPSSRFVHICTTICPTCSAPSLSPLSSHRLLWPLPWLSIWRVLISRRARTRPFLLRNLATTTTSKPGSLWASFVEVTDLLLKLAQNGQSVGPHPLWKRLPEDHTRHEEELEPAHHNRPREISFGHHRHAELVHRTL